MKTILIIGNCGVGKTYVMQSLILKKALNEKAKLGQVNMHKSKTVAVLGKYIGDTFDGSDKLSMSVATNFPALKNWANANDMTIVCEGDRFTNKTFISIFHPEIVLIEGDGKEGREKRGSKQTNRQIQSIATRVANINAAKKFPNSQACLDWLCKHLN